MHPGIWGLLDFDYLAFLVHLRLDVVCDALLAYFGVLMMRLLLSAAAYFEVRDSQIAPRTCDLDKQHIIAWGPTITSLRCWHGPQILRLMFST